jgi:hypothetical protein
MRIFAIAAALALATPAFADTYVDAHGCLVRAVLGSDGGVLYTNAVITDDAACAVQEDGPMPDEVAAPAPVEEDATDLS